MSDGAPTVVNGALGNIGRFKAKDTTLVYRRKGLIDGWNICQLIINICAKDQYLADFSYGCF